MFGDFEAQRHWMELPLHLPTREWYTYSPEWWQLDCELIAYLGAPLGGAELNVLDPPLSAYASWLCGRLYVIVSCPAAALLPCPLISPRTSTSRESSYLSYCRGAALDPTHFALDESRGLSPPALVTYLRASVLTFEALVWWSAVVAYMVLEGRKGRRSWRSQVCETSG
jgi:alpha-1,3-glucosyltransferase